ncbi:MAG: Gfo/Idh/MocA family oxidoreductase [Clostridia bacterium]|nr:Gfo/Idh/MocA family oxidoreductase [Clostridia bacterium]
MEKVRFGIIGVGNMGSSHAKTFLRGKVENGVLTAICDIKPAKTDAVRALELDGASELAVFSDYKEMLASGLCDAVIVAVPHYDHPRLTMDALNAGLHVICEKPAGVYTKQVKEMNEVAAKSDKLFTMMFNQRTNCVYRKMRELIQAGELGEIKRVNWIITTWYRSQSYYDSGDWRATWHGEGGGVLFNQCPHQLDLLQWVTGMMPARVHSFCHFGKWHDIEVEDDVTAYLEYENGATGVFITSTADTPGTNRFEILGNKGKLVCEEVSGADGKSKDVLTFERLETPEREFNSTYKGGFGQPKKETVNVETDGQNPQHAGIINNFANTILGIEPLFVDGKEGIRGVELMDSMLLSTWLGKTVSLPIDDDLYLAELNKRIATGRKKEGAGIVLDTEGTYS